VDKHAPESNIDLREYLQVLSFRKWTVAVMIVVVLGGVLAFSFTRTPIYQAQAKVLVKAPPTESGTVVIVDVPTQAEIISSEAVASLVRDELDYQGSTTDLLEQLSVEGIPETQVLGIAYTSPEPAFAQQAANSFADNYLEFRETEAVREVSAQEEAVQNRVDSASQQLNELNEELREATAARDDALAATLETSRSVLIARLGVLQQELDDLRSDRAVKLDAGGVIESATLPKSPVSPNHTTNGLLGLLLGLASGIGFAFLRERLDDRFKDRAEVERVLGVPVLATVPRFQGDRKESKLVSISQPDSIASEAYRSLRTNLQFIAAQGQIRSVLTTSPSAGEGKTVTTSNLAVALAQAGRRVILVSADLRRPTLERHFGLDEHSVGSSNFTGLSTYLSEGGKGELSSLIKDPGVPNIRLIPSGPVPPNPAELLASPLLPKLIRTLEENCDLVIIDSPPILAVADPAIVAIHTGGAILVMDAGSTHRSAVVRAKEELDRVGGNLIGCIFNGFDTATSPYYYYQPYQYVAEKKGGLFGRLPNGKSRSKRRRKSNREPEGKEDTQLSTGS